VSEFENLIVAELRARPVAECTSQFLRYRLGSHAENDLFGSSTAAARYVRPPGLPSAGTRLLAMGPGRESGSRSFLALELSSKISSVAGVAPNHVFLSSNFFGGSRRLSRPVALQAVERALPRA